MQAEKMELGPGQAALELNVGVSTVQRWIDAGRILAYRTPGGHRRIRRSDLELFAEAEGIPLRAPEAVTEILIVDDDPSVHTLLAAAVRSVDPDAVIIHAYNGFEAGVEIVSRRPAVVFLDIRMPGMNGIEVCEIVKANARTANCRVIGVTGVTESEVLTRLIDAGAEDVIRKPFDPTTLDVVMHRVIRRSDV
jgi:excisionase family DNA binding protein